MAAPQLFPTIAIDLGLGGSYRRVLINEQYNVGTWPLSELISTTAKDIGPNGFHGTYHGTGFTRGVTLDLPEGGLGLAFDGNGYIQVPDDADHAMSLDGGDIDIVALMKTTTNDATLRAIGQKMETDSNGNGWSMSLQNGVIKVRGRVGGSSVISKTDVTTVSDGAWHLVHFCYHISANEMQFFIDGVESGTLSHATSELATTTADLEIGQFADGSGRFIGSLAYFMIGREGDDGLGIALQAARAWTTVTADVKASSGIDIRTGMSGSSPLDRVATTGTCSFVLDNSASNSAALAGYYSPGHANCRSGFTVGIPVRFKWTVQAIPQYRFRGEIASIRPTGGSLGPRETAITAVDWMDQAAQALVSGIQTQLDINSTDVIKAVLDASDWTPVAVSIEAGSDVLPFALDNSRGEATTIQQELTRVATSEWGQVYIKGDITQGGILTVESRGHRQLATTPTYSFDNEMDDLDLEFDQASIVNTIRATVYPREVGSAGSDLYTLQQEQKIDNNATLTLTGQYTDSTLRNARVGALTTITPVATTDYTFNDDANGTGADFTADLVVDPTLGANDFEAALTNNNAKAGHLITFRIRGTPLYSFEPVTVIVRDNDSIRQYRERNLGIDMVYQTDTEIARSISEYILTLFSTPIGVIRSMSFMGNKDEDALLKAHQIEVGTRIAITETQTGLSDTFGALARAYYVSSVQLRIWDKGFVRATYGLSAADQTPAWTLDTSLLDSTTVLGV